MGSSRIHTLTPPIRRLRQPAWAVLMTLALLLVLRAASAARAARLEAQTAAPAASIHPVFALLDQAGENILTSGGPVSTLKTCGACHDTEYIRQHTRHANSGLDPLPAPGEGALSGAAAEMNCFLCHTPDPNNPARLAELRFAAQNGGDSAWASTATLAGGPVVSGSNGQYSYTPQAFGADGQLLPGMLPIQDPPSQNCGLCHATVQTDLAQPLARTGPQPDSWRGDLTGQVYSPGRISASGLNLTRKDSLTRSWDVHAERLLDCTDCHYAANNPVYWQKSAAAQPEHLAFDPRRLDLGAYLKQPSHQFARGSITGEAACQTCHEPRAAHAWLPYQERHFEALDCATCHVARLYNAAYQELDWTALHLDGSPRQVARGLEGPAGSLHSLVTGYQPIWLPEQRAEGSRQIAPFNLVTTWSWVHGESAQPVSRAALQAAWLDGAAYPPEVLATFDADGSGDLSDAELALDSQDKVQLISRRLAAQGLADPRLVGQVQPYRLSHGVAGGEWAVRECTACHASDSRLAQPMLLSTSAPGGAQPALDAGTLELAGGQLVKGQDGSLYYRPAVAAAGRYILGHNRVAWIDLFGSLAFAGALLGVVAHSSLRFLAALRRPRPLGALQRVYMYSVYERFWHWLQTFTILGLLFTGLVIHKPETFGIFSFRGVVLAHNALAAVVVINAALSLFYHLVSGEIRQYIPRPVGFYDQAILQARYYLRGIFKHEAHPFEKTPDKKLNPLQQLTYFGLLNVLLPLQVITGALMWGAQRWPRLTESLGGLPFLAPFHALIAWLFAAFIVGHVYLTTTGHTPLASIQAMMMGWDEIETPVPAEEVL